MPYKKKKRFPKRRILAIIIVVLIIVGIVSGVLLYQAHKRQHSVIIPSATINTNSSTNNSGTSNQSNNSQASGTNNSSGSTKLPTESSGGTSNTGLIQPSGTFVSNHMPGKNGSTDAEESTCNTSPGASCYIQFINSSDGITKKLDTKTADNNGLVIWDWNVSDAGFTAGNWAVSAIATLGNQTQSAKDSIPLVIQP